MLRTVCPATPRSGAIDKAVPSDAVMIRFANDKPAVRIKKMEETIATTTK